MRIISKERDYYDGVQASGQDGSLVYQRNRQALSLEEIPRTQAMSVMHAMRIRLGDRASRRYARHGLAILHPFAIAFCGKIYFGANAEVPLRSAGEDDKAAFHYQTFYDPEAFDAYIQTLKTSRRKYFDMGYRRYSQDGWDRARLIECMAANGDDSLCNAYASQRLSVVVYDGYSTTPKEIAVERDALLAPRKFYQVFSAWQAYQELAMWLGGVVASAEKSTIKIADTDLAQAKGFNERSFRHPPGKRARKRNRDKD